MRVKFDRRKISRSIIDLTVLSFNLKFDRGKSAQKVGTEALCVCKDTKMGNWNRRLSRLGFELKSRLPRAGRKRDPLTR